MSQSSLLYAVKTFILQKFTYNNQSINEEICDVMPDGRPHPSAGELFISVHPGGSRGSNDEVLWAIHSVNLSITLKTGRSPVDRVGTHDMIKKRLGILEVGQKLIETIHMNYHILQIANSYIDNPANKWVEPLRFNNSPPPRMMSADWVHSTEGTDIAIMQYISFSNAVRVQFSDYQPGVDIHDYVPGEDLIVGTPQIDLGPPYLWQEELNIPSLPTND